MKRFLPQLDATGVQIALKTCFALILDLAIALQLDWKPSFGAILVCVLQTPALGATYNKGMLYIAGTLGGAITGLAMVALFAHDRVAFIVAAALLTSFGVYREQVSRYPYAWLIFTVTAMLVGFFSTQDFANAFGIAVMRSSTICLAVVITFLVHGIFWPINAGKMFERQLQEFLEGCRELLSFTSRIAAGEETNAQAGRETATAQVKMIVALRDSLNAAGGDTVRFKRFNAGYLELIAQLRELLLAILAVHDGITGRTDQTAGRPAIAASAGLGATLQAVEGQMAALIDDLARPRDGTSMDREPAAPAGLLVDTAYDAMLASEVAVMGSRLTQVRALLARVEDPEQAPAPLPPPAHEAFSLTSVKSRKAAASGLVILLLGWFFIQTQWPMGLMLGMVFATIAIALGALAPLILVGRQLLLSLVIGAAIAAPLYFGIMPGISQYQQLIPWLCVALFPLLYMMASKPQKMIQYLFSAIFVIALLSLDEEGQSYSFSSFVNMWLGLCGGFGGALAVFGLFSSVVPEREFRQQVRSFFAGCGQLLQGLKGSAPETPASAAIINSSLQHWQGTLTQLQTWSSAINYQAVPGNNQQQTQALIESIEYLVLRLASTVHVRQQSVEALDELQHKQLGDIYDACIESLQVISNSLAELKPIPDLPDPTSLMQEVESRGDGRPQSSVNQAELRASDLRFLTASAQLRSLVDAIHDCRDKANALDWAAWNRNYF